MNTKKINNESHKIRKSIASKEELQKYWTKDVQEKKPNFVGKKIISLAAKANAVNSIIGS